MSQYPLVLFPDAVLVTVTLLNAGYVDQAIDADAFDAVPNNRPTQFTTVRRTGGARTGKVHERAQIAVESWAPTSEAAMDLAQINRGLIGAATSTVVESVPVGRVEEVSGPADLPDPLSDTPRVSQTFTIALRGAPPS